MSLTAVSRRPARRTRLAAAGLAVPLALGAALAGCSSGQITQTAEKRPSVEGAAGEIGDIKVHNVHFVAPGDEGKYVSGDTVELEFVVTTLGGADEITSITVDGTPATISSSESAEGSDAGTGGASSPTTAAASSIDVPAGGLVVIGGNGDYTVETTVTDELYPTSLLPVVITFSEAGDLEIAVPIAASLDEIDRDPSQEYVPGEGDH